MTFTLAAPARRRARTGGATLRGSRSAAVLAGFVAVDVAFAGSHGAPIGAYTPAAPTASSPRRRCTRRRSTSTSRRAAEQLAPGYIFTANFYDLNEPPMVGQSGPLILDGKLQPVWFQPVPEKRRRLQPEPADLRRQARARLVAGRRHEHRRDRKRRRRGRQPALPDGRDAERRRRLGAHAARDRDQRRRRLGDREQEHPHEPLQATAAPTTAR